MNIQTDKKWKKFKYRNEVPRRVLKSQFEHLDEDDASDGFFKYRNYWYHLSDFQVLPKGDDFGKPGEWDGYLSDTFFSGVLLKMARDGEEYKAGRFWS